MTGMCVHLGMRIGVVGMGFGVPGGIAMVRFGVGLMAVRVVVARF